MPTTIPSPVSQDGPIVIPAQQPLAGMESTDTNLRLDIEDCVGQVEKLRKDMKLLQLIVDSLPKKKAEDDPNFDEYEQYQNNVLMEDKYRRNSNSPVGADMQALKKKITQRLRSTIRESVTKGAWKNKESKEFNLTHQSPNSRVNSNEDVKSVEIRQEESQQAASPPPLKIQNPVVKIGSKNKLVT